MDTLPRAPSKMSTKSKAEVRGVATKLAELEFDQEATCLLLVVTVGKVAEVTINSLRSRLDCLGVAVAILATSEEKLALTLERFNYFFRH
jgi:hypothetical protein